MYNLYLCFFFFNDTATTEIYTLSLHDALPISRPRRTVEGGGRAEVAAQAARPQHVDARRPQPAHAVLEQADEVVGVEGHRSEEHTSELQSPCNLVCRLLLEKKKIHLRHVASHHFAHILKLAIPRLCQARTSATLKLHS